MGEFDRRLLAALQRSVPLVPRPYEQLAAELGASAEAVVARVAALGGPGGIIREIAGIFDAAALGYESTLVAAACPPEGLDEAGHVASEHPGVSHCYGRDGQLNLWFTLAVAPDSRLGLSRTVEILGRRIGAERILSLPALRRYKLQVRFELEEEAAQFEPSPPPQSWPPPRPLGGAAPRPTDEQLRAIRALQTSLPAMAAPFERLARSEGLNGDDLLVHAADFLAAGWMRRYAAVLRHQQAGAAVNVLVAWAVPQEKADAFGRRAAEFAAVSHCYLRAAAEGWPYNLYTMIHAGRQEQAARSIEAVAAAAGNFPRTALPTTREFKKARVRLFSPDLQRWEAEALT